MCFFFHLKAVTYKVITSLNQISHFSSELVQFILQSNLLLSFQYMCTIDENWTLVKDEASIGKQSCNYRSSSACFSVVFPSVILFLWPHICMTLIFGQRAAIKWKCSNTNELWERKEDENQAKLVTGLLTDCGSVSQGVGWVSKEQKWWSRSSSPRLGCMFTDVCCAWWDGFKTRLQNRQNSMIFNLNPAHWNSGKGIFG